MNYLFLMSRMRSLNYISYIQFKNKNKSSYEKTGEYSTAVIILMLISFRLWDTKIVPFVLPIEYLLLISGLLLQKQVIFVIKVVLFPVIWGIVLIFHCIFVSRCRSRKRNLGERSQSGNSSPSSERSELPGKRKPVKIDWKTNLGLDPTVKEHPGQDGICSRKIHRFKHRQFYSSNYCCARKCKCCVNTHIRLYPFLQWISLMYHDRNVYLCNQTCEHCGEQLRMFEKIIFPLKCVNYHISKSVKKTKQLKKAKDKNNPFDMASEDGGGSNALNSSHQSALKMVQNSKRPHYYHVICYDLIVKTMKDIGHNLKGADAAEFCLVCNQEEHLKREEEIRVKQEKAKQKQQQMKSYDLLPQPGIPRIQSAPDIFENVISERSIEIDNSNGESIHSEPTLCNIIEPFVPHNHSQAPVKPFVTQVIQPKIKPREEASDRDSLGSFGADRFIFKSWIALKEAKGGANRQGQIKLVEQHPKR